LACLSRSAREAAGAVRTGCRAARREAVQHVNSVQYFNKAHSGYAIIAVLNEIDVLTSGITSGNRAFPGKPGTRIAARLAPTHD
jgi:hypothetical protein